MNVSELISKLDHFFKEADGVQKFRHLVVNLAIRGAFTSQANREQCTKNLLELVRSEKQKHLTKVSESLLAITPDEIPVKGPTVPFVRLSDFARIEKGETGIQKAEPGEYPLVSLAAERASCNTYQIEAKAAIVPLISSSGHGHASMKRLHYQEGKFALANILCAVIPFAPDTVSARFIFEYLSAYKEPLLVSKMLGTANVSLTIGKIAVVPFPVVCSAAQKQVEELMSLCDEYEAECTEREARRDKLVTAGLHRLSNAYRKSLKPNASFYLRHLPLLTTRPTHIEQLRQRILDLAVCGRLVSQDPRDEPASALLHCLQKEKQLLVREGAIKERGQLAAVLDSEAAFPSPRGWAWTRLSALSRLITKGSSPRWQGVDYVNERDGVLFITSENVGKFRLLLDNKKFVDRKFNQIEPRSILARNDILLNIVGASIGRTALFDLDEVANINQAVCLVRPLIQDQRLSLRYLLIFLNSELGVKYMLKKQVDMARANLSMTNVGLAPIPLPPSAEQHRIVAKVEQLMGICQQMETQIARCNTERREFLESTLHQELIPAGARVKFAGGTLA